MTDTTNILITGTKAGIGYGLLQRYASLPNHTIIAAIRDEPASEIAQSMVTSVQAIGDGSRIIPVKWNASIADSSTQMTKYLSEKYPEVKHLDMVIANAAANNHWGSVASVTSNELIDHFNINAVGPTMLYQATRSLLLASPASNTPRFSFISTVAGSLEVGTQNPFPVSAYGASKAAANYIIRKANYEEDRLTLFAVHPGWVQTAPGNQAAEMMGIEKAPMTIEDSVSKLVGIMDSATKSEVGGTFQTVDGGIVPW